MNEINYSISGDKTQQLAITHKLGVILFIFGLANLINGYTFNFVLSSKTSTLVAFAFMLIGSMIFTFDPKNGFKLFTTYSKQTNLAQKIGLTLSLLGFSIIGITWGGVHLKDNILMLWICLGLMGLGITFYTYGAYAGHVKGIKNNYNMFNSFSARGILGWIAGIFLTIFYIQLYWYSDTLEELVRLFDPIAYLLTNKPANQWFVYGTLYTFVILFLGIKFMIKYRHNRYQLIRTAVVIFSQLVFAYFLPQIMGALSFNDTSKAGEYLGYYNANPVNTWPLNYEFFNAGSLTAYTQEAYQPVGISYLIWGILMFLVVTPVVTYYVGKRWYCSWFCGCGGLAETAGDSFRQLSSKSELSWKIERWVIHSVMVFILIMTVAILIPFFSGKEFVIGFVSLSKTSFFIITSLLLLLGSAVLLLWYKRDGKRNKYLLAGAIIFLFIFLFLVIGFATGNTNVFMIKSTSIKKAYGFFIGSAFSGVIGVGFYPVLGNRVWCRFGCPMAGYMGLFQRFKSRFRITTNGGQCISCGNCSTYCEQGIDVRAYAQKGQNIVRASCVGCGICSAVCPRGVLKLENGPEQGRINEEPNLIGMLKD